MNSATFYKYLDAIKNNSKYILVEVKDKYSIDDTWEYKRTFHLYNSRVGTITYRFWDYSKFSVNDNFEIDVICIAHNPQYRENVHTWTFIFPLSNVIDNSIDCVDQIMDKVEQNARSFFEQSIKYY